MEKEIEEILGGKPGIINYAQLRASGKSIKAFSVLKSELQELSRRWTIAEIIQRVIQHKIENTVKS